MPHEPDVGTIAHLAGIDAIERTLIEVYDVAVVKTSDPYVRQQLEECQRSHQMRADILVEEIEDLGGHRDAEKRDVSYAISPHLEDEAALLAALVELERKALAAYRAQLDVVDFDVRDLVEGDLLPEQERTAAILTSLATEH